MTAQIEGFVSRAQANLRPPRSISKNITPENGGSAGHYGGAAQRLLPNHDWCIRKWKEWQDYHMNHHGWADIAYTGGVCMHGYAFAGRGFFVRTAANGSSVGNQNFYAFAGLFGGSEIPTRAMLDGFDWWFDQARRFGKAGRAIRNHGDFKNTACSGLHLPGHLRLRNGRDIPLPQVTPEPDPEPEPQHDIPLVGAWTGGSDLPGVRRGAEFMLRHALSGGAADRVFQYGRSGDAPLVGRWRSGQTGVAVRRGKVFHLKHALSGGEADDSFAFGVETDIPLIGDWNGDGIDEVGVYRDGHFYLRLEHRGGDADIAFRFGAKSGDIPLVGDWNGDGRDTIGVYRDGHFHLRNELRGGEADISFRFGSTKGDVPLIGNWNGSGGDTVGVRRGADWHLRNALAGGAADVSFRYGR